jgi:hypothetical protein
MRMPWVYKGRLNFPGLRHDSIVIGKDAWRGWLSAPETTSFRFEGEDAAFTARRELRRGHAYWYAYRHRRRGHRLEKAYLGRSETIDLDRLQAAAIRLSSIHHVASHPVHHRHRFCKVARPGTSAACPVLPLGLSAAGATSRQLAQRSWRTALDWSRSPVPVGPARLDWQSNSPVNRLRNSTTGCFRRPRPVVQCRPGGAGHRSRPRTPRPG